MHYLTIEQRLAGLGSVVPASPPASLAVLAREVSLVGKRRSDKPGSRDAATYALGSAFEILGGLELDPLALTGIFTRADLLLHCMARDRTRNPNASVVDVLRRAFADVTLFVWARNTGAYNRWSRAKAIYEASVAEFERSEVASNPAHPCWKRFITKGQHHLVAEICSIEQIEKPPLINRGDAYRFIKHHAGNPRYLTPPALPTLSFSGSRA